MNGVGRVGSVTDLMMRELSTSYCALGYGVAPLVLCTI